MYLMDKFVAHHFFGLYILVDDLFDAKFCCSLMTSLGKWLKNSLLASLIASTSLFFLPQTSVETSNILDLESKS